MPEYEEDWWYGPYDEPGGVTVVVGPEIENKKENPGDEPGFFIKLVYSSGYH